ncbi:fungal fucose-specific lectin [Aspergillus pseudoustus]|uniref:Fucose-specific lectin n=1 Tax=Aspergillus pseudoustus TaxID=1810923 RepID=A0ABR4JY92_9EURO
MDNVGAEQIRFRCAISAINREDNIRVFSQDTSGGIREATCEKGRWNGGTDDDVIAYGILGTPIAALQKKTDEMTHVFFIGEGNVVREMCRDENRESWREGEINKMNIRVAPYSMMCACFVEGHNQQGMRLYVQMMDNSIQEFGCDDSRLGWLQMSKIGRALPGTGLACACTPGRDMCIRLFCQNEDMDIVEHCSRDGHTFKTGTLHIKKANPRTDLTAIMCGDTETQVYYVDRENRVREMCTTNDKWQQGDFDQPCVPGSQVAAVSWGPRRECHICVYFQGGYQVTAITEWKYHGRWEEGQRGLPPA